jgi:IstB-like ATP binding protein
LWYGLSESPLHRITIWVALQLPVDKWHEVIGEPTFADAILDRIVHNAYRLKLDGPSIRKTKATNAEVAMAGTAIDEKQRKGARK